MRSNRIIHFLSLPVFIFITLLIAVTVPPCLAGHLEPFRDLPPPAINPMTPEKIELGKMLFFDRRLSGDGTMSCATCHIPEMAFTDGQAIALSYPTTKNWRNTPTLINLAFNSYLFLDGRVETLEDQVLFPILSAFEMNQNLDFLEEEIRSVPEYLTLFSKAFGNEEITIRRIAMAIAAFERTLLSANTKLDQYLAGNTEAFSPLEKEGYEIFTGKGKCTECHYGINLHDNKFHALNIPEHPEFQDDPRVAATRRFVAKLNHYEKYQSLSEDPGRYLITKKNSDWRAFRTPTLREISLTAPYMHNGIFDTLEEVIDFFDQGGGRKNTILSPLNLSKKEKLALKTFLQNCLTGEERHLDYPKVP